ncbi:MAG TPA: 5'-nucleotidase C-terminal domain-containing protein [Bacillota bacterium]|nr:5'-nucleotidase C-terminal domain-containing protein [Bacillota bacterium]HPQ62018.1 5'-nucleotidase C-terminal domain-containing protein [Bacillota bacterium]
MRKKIAAVLLIMLSVFMIIGCDINDFIDQNNITISQNTTTVDITSTTTDITESSSTMDPVITTDSTSGGSVETTTSEDELILNISDVITGTIGDSYTIRATVIETSSKGLLVADVTGYVYVHLGIEPSFVQGDYLEITGLTVEYGGAVQFGSEIVMTKLSEKTIPDLPDPDILSAAEITAMVGGFTVGEYVELSGTLSVSSTYYNLTIEGTAVIGSLNAADPVSMFGDFVGQNVTVQGYVIYISGSTNKYLNIIVTDIEDNSIEPGYVTIATAVTGTVGDSYTIRATVIETSSKGLLVADVTGYVYVHLGIEPSFVQGDYLEITGLTVEYGGAVQFGSEIVMTKLSEKTIPDLPDPDILSAAEITAMVGGFTVGEYVELSGTLSVSSTYYNLTIEGTAVIGSLNAADPVSMFGDFVGQNVTVQGYVIYISGSTNKYLNIIVTDICLSSESDIFALTVITVNDLHGYIAQDDDGTGGISNMAYLINMIRNANSLDDVVLIGNGDMFQGTAVSNMTRGLSVIECMNEMDFDAMGIGNHDFDWGIDAILAYFDGDETNGEADFPLLNANIYLVADDTLLSVVDGNVFVYTIVEREGVQIGIISYIGDVYDSIIYYETEDYYFDNDIAASVAVIAEELDEAGVNIIVVNIHDGDSNGVEYYSVNNQLAALQNSEGEYLIDIVINGHTHSYQTGAITRIDGIPMLAIQAGGKGNAFGKIVLDIDMNTMTVTDYSIELVYVSSAGTNYDADVEEVVDEYLALTEGEVLAVAGETVSNTSQLQDWVGNVMLASTGADIAISNTGGIRATGNITAGEDVTVADLYEISPFDNMLILMEVTYSDIEELLGNSSIFYRLSDGVTLNEEDTYTLVIIDYVYGWDQMETVRSSVDINTGLLIRDTLIEDIRLKGVAEEVFNPISDPEANIGIQVF